MSSYRGPVMAQLQQAPPITTWGFQTVPPPSSCIRDITPCDLQLLESSKTILSGGGGGGSNTMRRQGFCKWFNVAKGWGFLTPYDGGIDVFVHQTTIFKNGFRSLAEGERVEFESKPSSQGMEATFVCGIGGQECKGSDRRPMSRKKLRKIRCYNCGDFANHIAAKCPHGPLPKRCHHCKSTEHLIAECPLIDTSSTPAATSTSLLQRRPRNGNNNNNTENGYSGPSHGSNLISHHV